MIHALVAGVDGAESMGGTESVGNALILTFGHKTVLF
jgi:hypothetical protein